jgi:sulfite dehydrogenase (quinone) subunit SoeC
MHPAFSVIFFTTASGAGFGLLVMLALLAVLGQLPQDAIFGILTLGTAFALITVGLLSSTLHLGRPERAWRAFSQWRSSWLSREGVAGIVTCAAAGLFGIGWVLFGRTGGATELAAIATAVCAAVTLVATGMIYASLKPIPQWHSNYTVPGYIIYALMSGATLLYALEQLSGRQTRLMGFIALTCIAAGGVWKAATWRHNDALGSSVSANSATGLSSGTIRSIEWPHTEENYVMKEMGFRIARKHAVKLRLFVQIFAFALPFVLIAAALLAGSIIAAICAALAVIAQAAGLLVERWLFFAEARHVVTLYYGR